MPHQRAVLLPLTWHPVPDEWKRLRLASFEQERRGCRTSSSIPTVEPAAEHTETEGCSLSVLCILLEEVVEIVRKQKAHLLINPDG